MHRRGQTRRGRQRAVDGVCLGHQSIGAAFGGKVGRAPVAIHGKTNVIKHHDSGLFQDLPTEFQATRYHSLIIAKDNLRTVWLSTPNLMA